jgi:hypothetical protein
MLLAIVGGSGWILLPWLGASITRRPEKGPAWALQVKMSAAAQSAAAELIDVSLICMFPD